EISPQITAFANAHGVELVERRADRFFDSRRDLFGIHLTVVGAFSNRQGLRKAQQVSGRHRTGDVAPLAGAIDGTAERLEKRLVQLDLERWNPALLDGNGD